LATQRQPKTAAPAAAPPPPPLAPDQVERPAYKRRQYGLAQLATQMVQGGWIENPDEVLRQFGSYEGLKFYFRMIRQFAFLGSPIAQRIDPVLGIERTIVPGDSSSDVSIAMADAARRVWADVRNKEVVIRNLLLGQFVGFYPAEKVWGIHSATNLLAPIELYDVPPQNVKFAPDGSPLILRDRSFRAEPVETRKLMFFRWGTVSTPYGAGELKNIYLATWYMQVILDLGLKALERLGPIPVVYQPRNPSNPNEADQVEEAVAEQFDFYLIIPTNEDKPRVDMTGETIIANGTAGRAENEWLRYIENWIWNSLVNTTQTQDRGGAGNGKLEEQRRMLKSDKTAATSDALDGCLDDGWMRDLAEVNWSNQPHELWPRFKSDTTEVSSDGLTAAQAEQADKVLLRLVANQMTEIAAQELLVGIGFPRSRAAKMISDTIAKRDELETAPDIAGSQQQAIAPQQGDVPAARYRSILMDDGTAVRVAEGDLIDTNRGRIPENLLASGDHIVTVRKEKA
jgi:hypothetical protein